MQGRDDRAGGGGRDRVLADGRDAKADGNVPERDRMEQAEAAVPLHRQGHRALTVGRSAQLEDDTVERDVGRADQPVGTDRRLPIGP